MHARRAAILFFLVLLLFSSFFVLSCRAQVIDDSWVEAIDSYCLDVNANTTAEIVVCVFPSLQGHGIKDSSGNEINDIVELGIHLFNDEPLETYNGEQTGIGKAGKDNGVLLVIAIEEQQYRFEVGYGLEGDITDIETDLIAKQYLIPAFQNGDYGEGIYDTVAALGDQIPASNDTASLRGYYYYESDASAPEQSPSFWDYQFYGMPLWMIIVIAILGVAVPVGGAARGGRSGGGGSGGKW